MALTLGGGAVGLAALIAAAAGDGERITGHWASARVGPDGTAQVTEVIDYDFGSNDRRGIFRDVPDLDPTAAITAESATAPAQFVVERAPVGSRIRIGDPDVTIEGRHRYTIGYPIDVAFTNERLSWNGVGDQWPVSIGDIELHLLAGNELVDIECSAGLFGAEGGCTAEQVEPGHLLVTVDSLDAFEGVTVSASRGPELATIPTITAPAAGIPDDPGTGLLVPGALAGGFGLLGAGVASTLVRRAGRERVWAGGAADAAFGHQLGEAEYATRRVDYTELGELASIEFAPPRGLTAWQGGIVHDEAVNKNHQVAWLLERAIAGEVGIAGGGKNLVLHRAPVDSPEADTLDRLFGGRRSIQLGTYDKEFASGWASLAAHLGDWHDTSPYWDAAGDRNKKVARLIGVLLILAGLAATVVGAAIASRVGLLLLPLVAAGALGAGGGLALLLRSWELRVRTPEGSGLWILTESFRRFIDQSDAQHVEAAAEQDRLLEYTAWAAALGEVDRWATSIREANLDGAVAPQSLYLASMATNLGTATQAAATAPSSSGGGGGGSVGGGGGGGGGGSW
ncbi:MAG: DUF2207 domain-containing protein [Actinomycetota bacterium]